MDDHEIWVGKMVLRYKDNKTLRAKLTCELHDAGKQLLSLAEGLVNQVQVERYTLHDSETIEVHKNPTHITPNLIVDIHGLLKALKEARDEHTRLEGCMREAGLGDLINR